MCIVHPVMLRLKVERPTASGEGVFGFCILDFSFIRLPVGFGILASRARQITPGE